jgi:outer membrane protein OmpA-like peptidoglycan-associated protein
VRRGPARVATLVCLLVMGASSATGAIAQPAPQPAPQAKPLSAAETPRYMRQLAKQLRAVIEGTPVELATAARDVVALRVAADYLFDLDAATLRAEAPVRLDPLVAVLLKSGRAEVVVVGHTDTLGTREFNAAWSLRRATAVADYLQAKGIPGARVGVRGAGELELLEKKEDMPDARARNRRIEIEVRPSRPSRRAAS